MFRPSIQAAPAAYRGRGASPVRSGRRLSGARKAFRSEVGRVGYQRVLERLQRGLEAIEGVDGAVAEVVEALLDVVAELVRVVRSEEHTSALQHVQTSSAVLC